MLKKIIGLGAAMALVGCGGGGGDSGGNSGGNTNTPSTPQCTATQYLEANVCKNKASQNITGLNLSAMTVGEKATLAATASSGLPVIYSSKTPTVCSVSGNQVTALQAGECSIAANQAGDANTLAAAEVVVKAIVQDITKASQSIAGLNLPAMAVGEKVTLAATASSGLAVVYSSKTPSICSVLGSQVTAIKAGECSIAANQAGNSQTLAAAEVTVRAIVSAQVITRKLTQTGITTCGNEKHNNLPCTKAALGDLHGAGQDGEVQAGQKMSYALLTQNGEDCVKDNVTGLLWEQKTDNGGLRDKDWLYMWYSTDSATNGGTTGYQDLRDFDSTFTGSTCGNSLTKCNTQAYVAALNAANYCGYSDWRMPSEEELSSIVDFGRINPSINPIFSHTKSSGFLSASPFAFNSGRKWYVSFSNGFAYGDSDKSYDGYFRAVRASQ